MEAAPSICHCLQDQVCQVIQLHVLQQLHQPLPVARILHMWELNKDKIIITELLFP